MEDMITIDSLTKSYGSKKVVDALSFSVPDGSVTGFLGPNGAGKSTTMRCILGLDKPTGGSATFSGTLPDGKAYASAFSSLDHKTHVAGAVLDASWFTPGRSGRNHLTVLTLSAGLPQSRVEQCLEMVGLNGPAADKKVGGYSLGMKQRLGLAGALLGDPQHLILDEPVNGLDPEGVTWIRQVIRRQASDGKAVLVSSHLLSEMQLTADRLVVIGKGKLIGEYSMDEFLADGTRVMVEAADPIALAALLSNQGFEVSEAQKGNLAVAVGEHGEQEIRRAVAQTALSNNLLITGLRTEQDNLEKRFLAATAGAQEYTTNDKENSHAR
ncbi:ABC transporter ATP-binding protein [Corynebacterium sp. 320]|nr:ABC transporter ATP-binding protein [Corynebacterium sp. 320]KAB1553372.1 ABC transporter ATP-binding protein [Corynebacterium sp. 321]KAB1554517.1 ABC transporter ATP-binding protein [Corynebacterium sp. 319]KAB3528703.1 ABC transporter ATP-binding protein [Corynebacterium sp. 250]KAB3540860.1 ABC transporter ATP-binding protein [Corynebacterium sp. 366]